MATWEVMLCCQCGHPTTTVSYPYRWTTACQVCGHQACLLCEYSNPFDQDSELDLDLEEQVFSLYGTSRNDNSQCNLTEAGSTRAENQGKSDLETPEILDNGQTGNYSGEALQAASPNPSDHQDFAETPDRQVLPPVRQQFSELSLPTFSESLPPTSSGPREDHYFSEYAEFCNSGASIQTIGEHIARMPRNFESEVLETMAWIDAYSPLATEIWEEMPDIFSEEPFFLPEETVEPDGGFPAK